MLLLVSSEFFASDDCERDESDLESELGANKMSFLCCLAHWIRTLGLVLSELRVSCMVYHASILLLVVTRTRNRIADTIIQDLSPREHETTTSSKRQGVCLVGRVPIQGTSHWQ